MAAWHSAMKEGAQDDMDKEVVGSLGFWPRPPVRYAAAIPSESEDVRTFRQATQQANS